jgi:hypothetical protein
MTRRSRLTLATQPLYGWIGDFGGIESLRHATLDAECSQDRPDWPLTYSVGELAGHGPSDPRSQRRRQSSSPWAPALASDRINAGQIR